MKDKIVGIDIGGTTVKLGILHTTGEMICKWEIPTDTSNEGKSIIQHVAESVENQLREWNIEKEHIIGIGVGAPGFINPSQGFVDEAVNIGWKNVDLTHQFQSILGLPVFLNNDANTAVLGENWLGSGDQEKNVLAVTLGTGVGGGIISNGEILNGVNGTAGEIGHITIDPNGLPCNCGRNGCLETIASATGMVNQAIELIDSHPESLLSKYYQTHKKMTAKDIFDLEKQGDTLAKEIIVHTTDVLGKTLANIALVLNPSKILIGGGVSKAGDQLLTRLKQSFKHYALPRINRVCELKLARLGNDAGIIGAAYLVKQNIEKATF